MQSAVNLYLWKKDFVATQCFHREFIKTRDGSIASQRVEQLHGFFKARAFVRYWTL